MRRRARKNWHLVVTRNAIIAAISLSVVGFVLLRGALAFPDDWPATKELTKELATTLFGLGVIALVWELTARRSFMREMLDSVELADEVAEVGLQQICWQYNQEINWRDLFDRSSDVDLFFSYAQTWRNNNLAYIESFAAKPGTRLRVVLPDYEDAPTLSELARRFTYDGEKLRGLISDTVKFYADLTIRFPKCVSVEVRLVPMCPMTALYLFSESGVLTLHSHQRKRVSVPTLLVRANKPVYTYLRAEFDALYQQGRQVFPVPAVSPPRIDHGGNASIGENLDWGYTI